MHRIMYMTPADAGYPDLVAGHAWIVEQIEQTVSARRQDPRQDLISILTHSEIRDEPIPHRRLVDMIFLIIAGGVDTTTSLLANAFVILGRRPDLRRRLIDEPELMLTAREEFLRYVTPTQSLARTATVETTLGDPAFDEHIAAG